MSEERYVKQIVSDVMEMAAKIKFLEAKVAASESWSAECTDDHKRELAAALRRAKAEGWREAIVGVTNLKADMENGVPPSERMGFSRACNEIIGYSKSRLAELDARAAQIEEGE